MGVMTVERRVLITTGRLLDLLTVGRLTDELLVTLLVFELLFLMGVMTVLRCEVDEPVDEPVLLRLATSTERLTGREKDGRAVETLGVDLGAGLDMDLGAGLAADLGAGLAAGLGAALRAGLDDALGADRDTRDGADLAGVADRDFDADFGAALLAGDDLAEGLDDLPLGGAALPNAGPKVIIAVRSTANSVFSNCLVNIFLAPFPGRCSGLFKEPTAFDPSGQIELFCFP